MTRLNYNSVISTTLSFALLAVLFTVEAEEQDVGTAKIRGACFDIDGTLSTHQLGYHPVGYFEMILSGMVCRHLGYLPVDALDMVCRTVDAVAEADPFLAADQLGIDRGEYRSELMRYQQKYLTRHNDTLLLLDYLATDGFPVYITTNNTRRRAELILDSLGIRSKITKIFTPQIAGARKNSPDFWKFVASDTGIPGNAFLVVGDEEISDSRIPLNAGFGRSYLLPEAEVRKNLSDNWLIKKFQDEEAEPVGNGNRSEYEILNFYRFAIGLTTKHTGGYVCRLEIIDVTDSVNHNINNQENRGIK